jgi:Domain of unknown function (DUF4164)
MTGVDQAVKRMSDALDALDAAIARRLEGERNRSAAAESARDAGIDLVTLRSELETLQARLSQLEIANREAVHHIGEAMTAICTVAPANQS